MVTRLKPHQIDTSGASPTAPYLVFDSALAQLVWRLPRFSQLGDVNVAGVEAGNVPVWDTGAGKWVPGVNGGAPPERFAGDPGVGTYYVGGTPDTSTWAGEAAITQWESHMAAWSGGATINAVRVAALGDLSTGHTLVSEVNNHLGHGRLPHITFGLPPDLTPEDAAAGTGTFAAWLAALAATFTSYAPSAVWWTFHPGPELADAWLDEMGGSLYRQVCRRLRQGLDAAGVETAAFFATGYACATSFGGATDWRWWYPDWKGTTTTGSADDPDPTDFYLHGDPDSTVDGIAVTVYSAWHDGDPPEDWTSFAALHAPAHNRMSFLGLPYSVIEHGIEALHTGNIDLGDTPVYDNTATKAYLAAMYTTMVDRGVLALHVYNLAGWRLELHDPGLARYEGYGLGMARPSFAAQIGIDSTHGGFLETLPASLLDAKGDLLVALAADTPARLAVGTTNGHVLMVDATAARGIKWAALPAETLGASIIDGKGDLITGTNDNAPARLPIGANGKVLTADSTETLGIKWATPEPAVLTVQSENVDVDTSVHQIDFQGAGVEVTGTGTDEVTVTIPGGSGGAGVLLLDVGDPVPVDTPVGTLVFRKAG